MHKLAKWLGPLAFCLPSVVMAELSDDEVRIGLITDMSSVYRDVGNTADISAEMAIEDFGGGVLNRPIRLYVRDHQLDPEVAMKHAKELHEEQNVDLFLEMVGTNVAIPLQRYARENDILAIHTGSASSILTGKECSPLGVHWSYDTHALSAGTAAAITQSGGKKWYFITADYTFGKVLEADATAVVERHGGEVVGRSLHPFKGTDFSAQLIAARESGADVIALANAGDDVVRAIRQAYELGMGDGEQQLVGLLLTETNVQQLGLYIASGVFLTNGFYWNYDDETRQWSERFRARSGITASMFGAGVYSAVLHYLKAVEAAQSDDSKTVLAKMRELPIRDMFARNARLRADGRMVHDMYLVRVKSPIESKGVGDYYEVVKVIPGNDAFRPLSESDCPHL